MKNFTQFKTLSFCAALAAFASTEAAPQLIKKADLMPMHGRQLTEHTWQKPAKVAAPATTLKQHEMQAKLAKPSRAKAEAYEYTYDQATYSDYGSDVWFTITTSDNAYKFYFDILGSEAELEMGKVYTMDDCDQSFTYLSDNNTYAMIRFQDLSLVLSMDDDQLLVDANCTTVNGDTYHLYYQPLEYPESFTEVAVGDLDIRFKNFTQTMGAFQFTGESSEYDLGLCMASDGQIEGSWTTADVFEGLNNYTYLYRNGQEIRLCDVEMQVASLGANNYHVDARMYGYDGNVYILNHSYVEPTPQLIADFVATNLTLDDSMFDLYMMFYGYGIAEISASNDQYAISGTILSYNTIAGHYNDADHKINSLTITDAFGQKTSIFSGDFDIEQTSSSWTIKGKMLGWNSTEYNVDLSFTIPEIAGEASYTSVDGELLDFTGSLGAFQVWAMDEEENEFSIVLDAWEVATGHYDVLSEDYKSFCYISNGMNLYEVYSGGFDITVEGDEFTMTGTCQAGELLYTINISGTYYPEEAEVDPYDATADYGEVDVTYTLDDIVDFEISAQEGYAYLAVESMERMDSWACMIFIDGNELPAGEYPFTETYEPGTAQTGLIYNNNLYPTMYFHFDADGYVTLPVWYCSYGSVTVDYDAEGNIVMDCEALNSNGVRVHVAVNPQGAVGIQQLEMSKAQQDGKFFEQNGVIIRSNGREFNAFGQLTK